MSVIRFGFGLVASATSTVGLFGLPLFLTLLGTFAPTTEVVVNDPLASQEVGAVFVLEAPKGPTPKGVAAPASEPESADDAVADATPEIDGEGPSLEGSAPRPSRRDAPVGAVRVVTGTPDGVGLGGPGHYMVRPGDAPSGPSASTGRKDCEPVDASIQALGDNRYELGRDLVDEYYGDMEAIQGLAGWIGKHDDAQGKADGFQVKGIRCGSVLHQAGLRSGDVIHEVNGKPVRNLAQALAAYTKLKRKDEIHLDISHRGERKELIYLIS